MTHKATYIIKDGRVVSYEGDPDVVLTVDVKGDIHNCTIEIRRPIMASIDRAVRIHMCPKIAEDLQKYGEDLVL